MFQKIRWNNVSGKIFSHQIFESCSFGAVTGCTFEHCVFLRDCKFMSDIRASEFNHCIMPDVNVSFLNIIRTTFKECNLVTADLSYTVVDDNSRFRLCDLGYIRHGGTEWRDCELRGCWLPRDMAQIVIGDKIRLIDTAVARRFI